MNHEQGHESRIHKIIDDSESRNLSASKTRDEVVNYLAEQQRISGYGNVRILAACILSLRGYNPRKK